METRKITTDDLTNAAANALGKAPEEIKTSETFEQAVYDMAAYYSLLNLSELNLTKLAQYKVDDDEILITYKRVRTSAADDIDSFIEESQSTQKIPSFIAELATFYNAYFPDTKVSAFKGYGSEGDTIRFLAAPFIDKVLPAMKLWKQKPSELVLVKDIEAFKRGPEVHKREHLIAYC